MSSIEMKYDAANKRAHNKQEEKQEESWRTPNISSNLKNWRRK